jgi:hypothetical protein
MTEHSEPDERERHALGEEDFADGSWDLGEGVSHTSNDNVLEQCCNLDEWGLSGFEEEVALSNQLIRQEEYYRRC